MHWWNLIHRRLLSFFPPFQPACCCLFVLANREREGDLQEMVDALKNGQYSALILDAPVLEHTVGTNEECDLFLVGDMFETFSIALAFPPAFDDAVIFAISQSIVKLQVRFCSWLWIVGWYAIGGGLGLGDLSPISLISTVRYVLQAVLNPPRAAVTAKETSSKLRLCTA